MKRRITPVFPSRMKRKDFFTMIIIAILVLMISFFKSEKENILQCLKAHFPSAK